MLRDLSVCPFRQLPLLNNYSQRSVFAGVVLCGMTRWVYWALCRALDTVQHEERAIQQMDTQALLDLSTSRDATYGVDHGQEA